MLRIADGALSSVFGVNVAAFDGLCDGFTVPEGIEEESGATELAGWSLSVRALSLGKAGEGQTGRICGQHEVCFASTASLVLVVGRTSGDRMGDGSAYSIREKAACDAGDASRGVGKKAVGDAGRSVGLDGASGADAADSVVGVAETASDGDRHGNASSVVEVFTVLTHSAGGC